MKESYNPKKVGERTEGQVLALMLMLDKVVLTPFGDNQRYDFVIEENGEFARIQCKTGRLRNGVVEFEACSSSSHRTGGGKRSYKGEADFFAVYCPDNKKTYWVPVDDVPRSHGKLRIVPPKNNQSKGVKWAKGYELNVPD